MDRKPDVTFSINSKLTAMKRTRLSSPMQHLYDEGLISSNHLDYGCGRGDDADLLMCDKYDPNFQWNEFPAKKYDSISCIYVLNVIESSNEREDVVGKVMSLLNPGGKAYFAVRRDKFEEGYTKRGTWQGWITLGIPFETIYEQKGRFCLYQRIKEE